MKKYLLIVVLIPICVFAQSIPLKDLGLTPTIKVHPTPKIKEQKAAMPVQAASAASAVPITLIKK